MDILLTIVSALLGWLVSDLYARKAAREQREELTALKSQIENLSAYLRTVVPRVERDNPRLAEELRNVVEKRMYPAAINTVVLDGDTCPSCGKPTLKFDRWGNGPLGSTNAWFACSGCGHTFQTAESPQD